MGLALKGYSVGWGAAGRLRGVPSRASQSSGRAFRHARPLDPSGHHRLAREDGQVRLYPLRPKGLRLTCPLVGVTRWRWSSAKASPSPLRWGRGPGPRSTYPTGGRGSYPPRGAAPRGARLPGGGPAFFIRKQGERIAGVPPAPLFMAARCSLALFWGRRRSGAVVGFIAAHVRALIWRLSFLRFFQTGFFHRAISSKKYFLRKCVSKSGLVHFCQKETVAEGTQPKRWSEPQRAVLYDPGPGRSPGTLCVRAFSRESLDPRPGQGRETTWRVLTCDEPNGTASRRRPRAPGPTFRPSLGRPRRDHLPTPAGPPGL